MSEQCPRCCLAAEIGDVSLFYTFSAKGRGRDRKARGFQPILSKETKTWAITELLPALPKEIPGCPAGELWFERLQIPWFVVLVLPVLLCHPRDAGELQTPFKSCC